jgi:fumarate reductase subunit D
MGATVRRFVHDKSEYIYIFILTIMHLLFFCLGIIQGNILNKNNEYYDECRNIFNWIIFSSVLNIIYPIIYIFLKISILFEFFDEDDDSNILNFKDLKTFMKILLLGYCVLIIWSFVTYVQIDSTCYIFWTTLGNNIWKVFTAQCIMFMVAGSVFTVYLMCYLLFNYCCDSYQQQNHQLVNNGQR